MFDILCVVSLRFDSLYGIHKGVHDSYQPQMLSGRSENVVSPGIILQGPKRVGEVPSGE